MKKKWEEEDTKIEIVSVDGPLRGLRLGKYSWCSRHGKSCECQRAGVHVAGTSCTDHSSMGEGKREDGPQGIAWLVWVASRRQQRECPDESNNIRLQPSHCTRSNWSIVQV